MRAAQVLGVGLWTPRAPSWEAWRQGIDAPAAARPACAGVPPTLLRGTSVATCAALEAMRQAAAAGGADLREVATVFGSTLGEIQTAVALSAMIRAEGLPSPMRFKNSVHNAAAGVASIAHGNTRFTTSLSAAGDLAGVCLLEALAWLDEAGGDVIVALAEEETPAPLAADRDRPALALALLLRAGEGPLTLERLTLAPEAPAAEPPPPFGGCPVAAALPMLQGIAARRPGSYALSLDGAPRWRIDLVVRA